MNKMRILRMSVALLLVGWLGEVRGETAGEVIARVEVGWTEEGWDAKLSDAYMRRFGDKGW
jgi:hypothetical protein